MIYLLTSDGHRDSIDLDYYCTNEEELINLVYKHMSDCFGIGIIKNVIKVDFERSLINFIYIDYDGEIEEKTYHFITIKKYEKNNDR